MLTDKVPIMPLPSWLYAFTSILPSFRAVSMPVWLILANSGLSTSHNIWGLVIFVGLWVISICRLPLGLVIWHRPPSGLRVMLVVGIGWLVLNQNALAGSVPTEFSRLNKLRFLRLHDNNLEGSIPEEICKLQANNWWFFMIQVDCYLECSCRVCVCDSLKRTVQYVPWMNPSIMNWSIALGCRVDESCVGSKRWKYGNENSRIKV